MDISRLNIPWKSLWILWKGWPSPLGFWFPLKSRLVTDHCTWCLTGCHWKGHPFNRAAATSRQVVTIGKLPINNHIKVFLWVLMIMVYTKPLQVVNLKIWVEELRSARDWKIATQITTLPRPVLKELSLSEPRYIGHRQEKNDFIPLQ